VYTLQSYGTSPGLVEEFL